MRRTVESQSNLYSNICLYLLLLVDSTIDMSGDKLPVQIRTRKFIRNALLDRRQFVSVRMSLYVYLNVPFLVVSIWFLLYFAGCNLFYLSMRRWWMLSILAVPMLASQSYRRRSVRWVGWCLCNHLIHRIIRVPCPILCCFFAIAEYI